MSGNIHGFGGSSNNNNDNNYKPVQMMGSVDNSSANPREETFFLLNLLCMSLHCVLVLKWMQLSYWHLPITHWILLV